MRWTDRLDEWLPWLEVAAIVITIMYEVAKVLNQARDAEG